MAARRPRSLALLLLLGLAPAAAAVIRAKAVGQPAPGLRVIATLDHRTAPSGRNRPLGHRIAQ
jgi:hypothetical protein